MTRAIVIECPICRKRVSMRKAVNHGRNRHADIDLTEYISIIKETKNKGLLRYKQYKTPRAPKSPVSGTNVLQQARNASRGVTSIISAGAFGMGKKR